MSLHKNITLSHLKHILISIKQCLRINKKKQNFCFSVSTRWKVDNHLMHWINLAFISKIVPRQALLTLISILIQIRDLQSFMQTLDTDHHGYTKSNFHMHLGENSLKTQWQRLLYRNNSLDFVTDTGCAYCAVGAISLNTMQVHLSPVYVAMK